MVIPKVYEQPDLKDTDPWYQFKGAIDEFNRIRKVSQLCLIHIYFRIQSKRIAAFYFFYIAQSYQFLHQNYG